MQLYALDQIKRLVVAGAANKQQDYHCIECNNRVRLRGGMHRQKHFYHIEPNLHCRLHGKGMVHIQIQNLLLQKFPVDECQLEYRFPEINRIADVAWIPQKIIFEIQCSPITADEVRQRNKDYGRLGWEVIWILHDERYNKWRLTAAEEELRASPHYFTNIDSDGKGFLYDQFDLIKRGVRHKKMKPLQIEPTSFKRLNLDLVKNDYLLFVNNRLKNWSLALEGDLIHLSLNQEENDYVLAAREMEAMNEGNTEKKQSVKLILGSVLYKWFIRPYLLFFQMLLERACK